MRLTLLELRCEGRYRDNCGIAMAAIEDSVRPLSEPELRLLSGKISSQYRRQKRYRGRIVKVALVLWAGGSALTLLANRANPRPVVLLAWAGIAVVIAAWMLLEDRFKTLARIRSLEDAFRRGEAHVIRIRSDEMVEFEEEEDEGVCYAFQVGDRIVFISGQDFYPSAKFPNSDFSLVEMIDGGGSIVERAIVTSGKKLQPIRTIAAELKSKLRIPEHLQILQGRLEDIDRLLSE
jgi:hypothetical protein